MYVTHNIYFLYFLIYIFDIFNKENIYLYLNNIPFSKGIPFWQIINLIVMNFLKVRTDS